MLDVITYALLRKQIATSGGVQPDWNQNDETQPEYIKNRPYYQVTERKQCPSDGIELPVTVTTQNQNEINFCILSGKIILEEGLLYEVVFNGKLYKCIAKNKEGFFIGGDMASLDFSEYPFIITENVIATENEGQYTIDIYVYEKSLEINYAPTICFNDEKKDDGRYLSLSDVEKIKDLYKKDVVVYIHSVVNGLGVKGIVNRADNYCITCYGYADGISPFHLKFISATGKLEETQFFQARTIVENNNLYYPEIYFKGSWYRINIDKSGAMTATKVNT